MATHMRVLAILVCVVCVHLHGAFCWSLPEAGRVWLQVARHFSVVYGFHVICLDSLHVVVRLLQCFWTLNSSSAKKPIKHKQSTIHYFNALLGHLSTR